MNLKEIAAIALDAADEQEEPTNAAKTKGNGDGTVTLSVSFSLDPKVVAEKAKAMPKGVKRDDLVDSDLEEDGDDREFADDVEEGITDGDENEGEGSDESAEDSADTVFMDALDSIEGIAEDARSSSRHRTPIENCRAKDPRFCPYHGDQAWKKYITEELSRAGINYASVNVLTHDDHSYTASLTVSQSDEQSAIDILTNLGNVKGVTLNGAPTPSNMVAGLNSVGFKTDYNESEKGSQFAAAAKLLGPGEARRWANDRKAMLDDYIDDYMVDYADDPNADIDLDDFSEILAIQDELDGMLDANGELKNPNDADKYVKLVGEAMEKYHPLIAQQYMRDVNDDSDATSKATDINTDFTTKYADIHDRKDVIDDIKNKLFGLAGKFPPGFAKANPFVDKYNKESQRLFHWATSDYQNKLNDVMNELSAGGDIKKLRTLLAGLDYARESFENGTTRYQVAADTFENELYDWAKNEVANPSGKYEITQANIDAAWPNGTV